MDEESREAVVVGEDSVESEADVEVLFLGWWKGAKEGGAGGLKAWSASGATGEAGGGARSGSLVSRPWRSIRTQAGSRTWMNDGRGSTKAGEGGDCMMEVRCGLRANLSKLAFLLCDRSADRRGVFGEGSETGTAAERQNSIFLGDGQSSRPKAESRSRSWSATDLLRSGSLAKRTTDMSAVAAGDESAGGGWEVGKPGERCSVAIGGGAERGEGVQEQVFWQRREGEG
jgi:hypothetical protein